MDQKSSNSRRQFLQGFVALVGSATANTLLSNKAIAAALAYQANIGEQTTAGKIFNLAELQLLKQVAQLTIPRTDTLGAGDVDCHGFIDNQLHHCYQINDQQRVINILSVIANSASESDFIALNDEHQLSLLIAIELSKGQFSEQNGQDIKFLKSLICFGYYTSEVGASKTLKYDAIPGGFTGSVPFKAGDRGEGALAYY